MYTINKTPLNKRKAFKVLEATSDHSGSRALALRDQSLRDLKNKKDIISTRADYEYLSEIRFIIEMIKLPFSKVIGYNAFL